MQGSTLDGLFSIPRKSVYGDGQVLIIEGLTGGKGSLKFRKVNPIYADEQNIYINRGLEAGDRVSLTPLSNPVEGMRVRIKGLSEKSDADVADAALALPVSEG